MRVLSPLVTALALPVVVSGFQAFAAVPNTPNTMSVTTLKMSSKSDQSNTRKRPNATSSSRLQYTDDVNAIDVQALAMSPVATFPNGGGITTRGAIQYLSKAIPTLAIATALGVLITNFLSGLSSPAAQGLKLVYAGAIAGIISRTCCAPIEMVSTVMMCRGDECTSMWSELDKTWKREGLKGMFKGNGANCLKVAPSRGTQFLVYEFVKRKMVLAGIGMAASGAGAGSLHAGARLCAGGIAGMVAASIVYPLEVVKTMLTLYPDRCKSITDALAMVYKSAGVGGLYRGLGPTLIAMFPYVGVEFMVYETLKNRWEMHIGPVGTVALLLLGAAGGAAAQASAHPLDVIRRRMQMQSMNAEKKDDDAKESDEKAYSNMFTGLYRVGKNEGLHVLFKGLGPACLEKIPSTAIGYFIYEFLKVAMNVASV